MSRPRRPALASRRAFVAGAVATVALAEAAPASATAEAMREAIKAVVGSAPVRLGKVALDLPPLVENGNTVPLSVVVDSPMTAADHVVAIHVFNEKNPQPHVFSATLGPRAGRAALSTRIKLADSQTIVALAQTSDGVFWRADAAVIVTLAACVEDLV